MQRFSAIFISLLFCATCVLAQSTTLNYSTLLGGNGVTQATSVALDVNGNAYVTGNTVATNLATPGAFQTNFTGTQDAFVAEFDTNGALVFCTYLGGGGSQSGQGIAVDLSGNIFVAGCTSSTNFPVANALQATNAGGYDAFVTELAPGGTNLVF